MSKLYSLVDKIIENIIRWRFPVLIFVALIFSASFVVHTKNLNNSDNGMPVWIKHDDPTYVYYQKFTRDFDNDLMIAVAFRVPHAFGREELLFTQAITEKFKEQPYVSKVLSLTEYETFESENDSLVVSKVFKIIPQTQNEIDSLKSKITSDRTVQNILTNQNHTLTAFYLYLDIQEGDAALSRKIIDSIEKVIRDENIKSYPHYMVGRPVGDTTFDHYSLRDQRVFLPVLFLLIMAITYFFFRNIYASILPMTVMIVTVIVMTGLFYTLGYKMNAVTAMMGTILIAVCVADSVHMMLTYYECQEQTPDRLTAIKNASKSLLVPCFFTALTTFAGFLSFNASPLVPNQVLGQFSAAGVMLAYLLTIFFLPILIYFLPKNKSHIALVMDDGMVQKFLSKTFHLVSTKTNAVFYFFMALTLISLWGTTKVGVETNVVEYFPKSDKIRTSIDIFENELSGANTAELIINSKNTSYAPAIDPHFLQTLETFLEQSKKNHSFFISKTITYSEYLKKLNQAFHDNNPAYYSIPNNSDEIAQLLLLAESAGDKELSRYKTLDNNKVRVNVRSHWRSSESMNAFTREFEREAKKAFSQFPVDIHITGGNAVWLKVDDSLLKAEYYSFGTALIAVFIMMIMVLKSVRAGFFTMIPNVIPIFMTLGLMGLLNIKLNIATVMTAGICIGITVDDSIHYLMRFKKILSETKNYSSAILETNKSIGTAVIFTSVVLILGFGVMGLSNFQPMQNFGVACSITIFFSIFTEIFLMPVLLLKFKPFKIT